MTMSTDAEDSLASLNTQDDISPVSDGSLLDDIISIREQPNTPCGVSADAVSVEEEILSDVTISSCSSSSIRGGEDSTHVEEACSNGHSENTPHSERSVNKADVPPASTSTSSEELLSHAESSHRSDILLVKQRLQKSQSEDNSAVTYESVLLESQQSHEEAIIHRDQNVDTPQQSNIANLSKSHQSSSHMSSKPASPIDVSGREDEASLSDVTVSCGSGDFDLDSSYEDYEVAQNIELAAKIRNAFTDSSKENQSDDSMRREDCKHVPVDEETYAEDDKDFPNPTAAGASPSPPPVTGVVVISTEEGSDSDVSIEGYHSVDTFDRLDDDLPSDSALNQPYPAKAAPDVHSDHSEISSLATERIKSLIF